jgi:hypothetical protein
MTDVLKYKRNLRKTYFGPQQVIMIILELSVCEVIPALNKKSDGKSYHWEEIVRASIPVQESRRFHNLLAIPASLALECVMRLAESSLVELEQLAKSTHREMPLRIFFFIHYSRRQGLLGSLTLEYLLFYRSC